MAFVEAEELSAVLKPEPKPERTETAPHSAEVALDERDHAAFTVRRREVNGVPDPQQRIAALHVERGAALR